MYLRKDEVFFYCKKNILFDKIYKIFALILHGLRMTVC